MSLFTKYSKLKPYPTNSRKCWTPGETKGKQSRNHPNTKPTKDKGGITQIKRQGIDTMVDVLYEDLDEEQTTLQDLLPDIALQNSVRRSHHIKGLLTLAKGMDKSLKSTSKTITKAHLARRKRSVAKTAPYHRRTRSALIQPNTDAKKSTVVDFMGSGLTKMRRV